MAVAQWLERGTTEREIRTQRTFKTLFTVPTVKRKLLKKKSLSDAHDSKLEVLPFVQENLARTARMVARTKALLLHKKLKLV